MKSKLFSLLLIGSVVAFNIQASEDESLFDGNRSALQQPLVPLKRSESKEALFQVERAREVTQLEADQLEVLERGRQQAALAASSRRRETQQLAELSTLEDESLKPVAYAYCTGCSTRLSDKQENNHGCVCVDELTKAVIPFTGDKAACSICRLAWHEGDCVKTEVLGERSGPVQQGSRRRVDASLVGSRVRETSAVGGKDAATTGGGFVAGLKSFVGDMASGLNLFDWSTGEAKERRSSQDEQ